MAKKKRKEWDGIVYSEDDVEFNEENETIEAHEQDLRVLLDKKNRKGKPVTLITGFIGTEDDLKTLGKALKMLCGVGGSTKNGEILVQGDFRDKVCDYLQKENYGFKRL